MDEKDLWNEILILQAENSLLRRKLGKGYQDFEYYRSFCHLERYAEENEVIRTLLLEIKDLPFSARTKNVLLKARIYTLGDLVQYDLFDILVFPNFGKKSVYELKSILKEHNLTMGMDVESIVKEVIGK